MSLKQLASKQGWEARIGIAGFVIASLAVTAPAQMMVAPISVAEVVKQEVRAGRSFVGTVRPMRRSVVGSPTDQRVVEFPVNAGDRVTKGETLARLYTRTLDIQLAGAKAELELRKQQLAELEHGSRPEEIGQARARLAAAKARMTYADYQLERVRQLQEKVGAAPEEERQRAIADAEEARQSYTESQATLALAEQGPRQEKIAQARASVQVQEEEVNRIQNEIDRHTIVAPFDGYIVVEHTEVGEWLTRGAPVVEIVELDTVEVEVPVLEDYVSQLHLGTEARVEIASIPGEVLTGAVYQIVPQADERSRTFPVKVKLENPLHDDEVLLKGGMFTRVTLPVGAPREGLLVPKDALVLGGPSPMVYVVDLESPGSEKGKVRPVPVQLGIASGGLIELQGELQPGQLVVVLGNERLRPGQDVTIMDKPRVPSSAAPPLPLSPSATYADKADGGRG